MTGDRAARRQCSYSQIGPSFSSWRPRPIHRLRRHHWASTWVRFGWHCLAWCWSHRCRYHWPVGCWGWAFVDRGSRLGLRRQFGSGSDGNCHAVGGIPHDRRDDIRHHRSRRDYFSGNRLDDGQRQHRMFRGSICVRPSSQLDCSIWTK